MEIIVKHSKHYKPVKVEIPINWSFDPYGEKSWLHHFNSLRWLLNESDVVKIEAVLRSFYNYHCVKKRRNHYYNYLRGDHTAAIRLSVFTEILTMFSNLQNVSGQGICKRLIKEELINLQDPKMYRAGHNHGLMVDLALLKLIEKYPEFSHCIDIDLIIKRSSETVDAMWHPFGLTKEHSVSYQEYNMPLTVDYFSLLDSLCIERKTVVSLESIVKESKFLLGYALKADGEYFPLGDSFRTPNVNILRKMFGQNHSSATAHDLLAPFSSQKGCYGNENFFIYRNTIRNKDVHFAATCCWDSNSHKQNDELSFCLEVDGITIFDDPGYTEFLSWERIQFLKSEKSHSTISIDNCPWDNKLQTNKKSKINLFELREGGFYIEMFVERAEGFKFIRSVELKDANFYIKDKVVSSNCTSFNVRRRFFFGKDIGFLIKKPDMVSLIHENNKLANVVYKSSIEDSSDITFSNNFDFVMAERTIVDKANVVTISSYVSSEQTKPEFFLYIEVL